MLALLQPEGNELTPLTSLARPPSWRSIWPVAVYHSLLAKIPIARNEAEAAGSDDDEDAATGDDNVAAPRDGSSNAPLPKKKAAPGGKLAAMRRRKASMK